MKHWFRSFQYHVSPKDPLAIPIIQVPTYHDYDPASHIELARPRSRYGVLANL